MSSSFSTITPLNPATISRMPSYAVNSQPQAQQPAASNPINDYGAPKKKSHWFRNTVIGLVVLAGVTAALRGKVGMFKDFDKAAELAKDAKFLDKAAHYGKKGVAVVGDFLIDNGKKAWEFIKGIPARFKSSDAGEAGGSGIPGVGQV